MIKKICPQCKNEFCCKYSNQIYCSKACLSQHKKQNLVYTEFCKQCGDSLEEKGWTKKFCCKTCSSKYANSFKKHIKIVKNCTRCGQEFIKDKFYCSKLCKSCKEKNDNNNEIIRNMTVQEYVDSHMYSEYSNKHAGIRDLCRRWNKHLENKPCQNCGYSLHTEFCHIKEISKNKSLKLKEINDPSNILILCKNCHWEFDHGYLNIDEMLKDPKI